VVAIEDAVTLKMAPSTVAILADIPATCPEWIPYVRPPRRYDDMMKVSVTTIRRIPAIIDSPCVKDMLQWQAGQLEYAVAALAIWMTTDVGLYVCTRLAIWKIPLSRWDGS